MNQNQNQKRRVPSFFVLVAMVLGTCLDSYALSNKVTLQDKSGAGQGTRQWPISRYFAKDEICDVPRPYVSGAFVTNWQSHVLVRWPSSSICASGSVQHAVIVIEMPVGVNAAVDIDFQNSTNYCSNGDQSTCNSAGMTKTDILNFDAGGGAASWGAKICGTTGGIELCRSARQMITDNHYQILKNGPFFTEILVREGPDAVSAAVTRTTNFGWQCTANCVGPYAGASWADNPTYYSIRPTFWIRIYRLWGKVEVDVVLHSGWMDRWVDQRLNSYVIYTGGAETTAAFTQANPIVISPRQTVWEGPFWNGGTPGASHIDYNPRYLMYSKLMPTLDMGNLPTSVSNALEVTAFNATDQGATTTASITPALGWAGLNRAAATAGANAYLGLFPRWTVRYLATQQYELLAIVIGNMRGLMHFPFAYLETDGPSWIAGSAASPFGRPASLEKRPTLVTWYAGSTNTTGADQVTSPTGAVVNTSCGTCMVASSGNSVPWISTSTATYNTSYMDRAHQVADFFIPYIITGKPLFLEALQHMAAYNVGAGVPSTSAVAVGRQFERGIMDSQGNYPRGYYWPMRALGQAAIISPDGTPEKMYFKRLLDYNLEASEGRLEITDGSYPPSSNVAPYGCPSTNNTAYYNKTSSYSSPWCFGRYSNMQGLANPMGFVSLATGINSPIIGSSMDARYASEETSAWMIAYGAMVYGHLRDIGVTTISKVQDKMNQFWMKLSADTGVGKSYGLLYAYRIPVMNANDTAMLTTPGQMLQGLTKQAQVAKPVSPTDTLIYSTKFLNSGQGPGIDLLSVTGRGSVKVGNEEVTITDQIYLRSFFWRGNITASNDYLTFTISGCYSGGGCSPFATGGVHFFADGDMTTVANGGVSVLSGLPIVADPTNCHSRLGNDYCTYYVKVINSTTIQLYKDAGLTQLVDFTSDVSTGNVYAGLAEWTVQTTNLGRCGGISCRGVNGTTATSHAVGEVIEPIKTWMRLTNISDVDSGYASHYRASVAYAASYDSTIVDSVTGKTISGGQAYKLINHLTGFQDYYNDRSGCTGRTAASCGNPKWGWIPYQGPKNVRATVASGIITVRYVPPDAQPCRVGVSTAFNSSDDFTDTVDTTRGMSRKVTLSGYPSGNYLYRVTCSTGRVIGTLTVQ